MFALIFQLMCGGGLQGLSIAGAWKGFQSRLRDETRDQDFFGARAPTLLSDVCDMDVVLKCPFVQSAWRAGEWAGKTPHKYSFEKGLGVPGVQRGKQNISCDVSGTAGMGPATCLGRATMNDRGQAHDGYW